MATAARVVLLNGCCPRRGSLSALHFLQVNRRLSHDQIWDNQLSVEPETLNVDSTMTLVSKYKRRKAALNEWLDPTQYAVGNPVGHWCESQRSCLNYRSMVFTIVWLHLSQYDEDMKAWSPCSTSSLNCRPMLSMSLKWCVTLRSLPWHLG